MSRAIHIESYGKSDRTISVILFRVREEILGDITELAGIYVICANQIKQTLSGFVFGGDVEKLAAFGAVVTAKLERKLIPAAVFLM